MPGLYGMWAQQTQVVNYVEQRMQLANLVRIIRDRDGDFGMCGEEESVALDTFALVAGGWHFQSGEVGVVQAAGEARPRHL